MSTISRQRFSTGQALAVGDLVFHTAVRHVRKGHGSGPAALGMNIVQTFIYLGAFYLLFAMVPGMRGQAVRGDFVLYLMTGIFLFMTHIKAVSAVVGADGPGSPMMAHAPMTTAISVAAAALSSLYLQALSMLVVLFGVHVAWHPVEIAEPGGFAAMFGLAWLTGIGLGMVLLACKPWAPGAVVVANALYSRINMIASGQMFVANALPASVLVFFDWNPLFHAIDQARGHAFVNYVPHHTGWAYPLAVGAALFVIGLMAEFFTSRRASSSWLAAQ